MRLSRDWHEGMGGSVLQAAYIIDDCGEVTRETCGRFRDQTLDMARHLVNHLGYVAYLVADRHIHIKFRPSLTSIRSYARLMRWLDCQHPQRVLVSYLCADEWRHEFTGSGLSAARCVDRIMERYGGGPLGNIRRETLSMRPGAAPPAFRHALAYWQANRTNFDPVTATPHLRAAFNDRFVLSTEVGPSRDFVIGAFGSNRDDRCRRWLSLSSGMSIRSAPDPAYGASVANAYAETMRLGEPLMDNIDALVSWTGGSRARYRYSRLMLPFIMREERWLVSYFLPAPHLRLLA